ncbi:unnamed protein product [Cylindrotheca closterium]|uniref:Peroxisomal ATPase PEX6 n=1 Tax=Cylindrotheca closterium TaxID=2856 RepID=A0AAD2FGK8_9STRA|nr:unnamed protein product [Cylindrotheca closterium]
MLRISKFCKGDKKLVERVGARLTLLESKDGYGHITSSTCHVPFEILSMMGAQEEIFVFLCYRDERVIVRLLMLEEENDDGETAMASPIVFSNLGFVFDDEFTSEITIECWFELIDDDLAVADSVVLRPLGHKPVWPSVQKGQENDGFSWILPSSKEFVQESKILSVYSNYCFSICYYEVLAIHASDGRSVPFGIISPFSKIELEGSSIPSSVCRLPPLPLQEDFYTGRKTHQVTLPHPNLTDLLKALCQPSALKASEKVIHVIGTDATHRACRCIEAAAHQLGLQCFHLRGLAAFGYHHGKAVRNGSLAEQLSGLQAAFQLIRAQRIEPCVLHLYDFDLELSSEDDHVRHDQEERFWAQFMQAVETDKPSSDRRLSRTSPIMIVITTCSPLKVGPLMKNLVFPSVVLKPPDEEFARSLWNSNDWQDSFWDSRLLKGRSADEIVQLCRQVQQVPNVTDKLNALMDFCKVLDERKRKESSQSASVSNVRWEDVGGLAHVRREIMDAIELPLKHPHLFPGNQGRSGILLYGPPGTGKTLVAKAVATECGLPFFSVKGPELLGSYVGESEASVRAIFHSAREAAVKNAPVAASVLFFDELDSLAPRRGGVGDGGGVMERVAATLFSELDGTMPNGRIFVMGATNRPDLLDPSLLRPGRLDRLVYLGVPVDSDNRTRVLAAQIRTLSLEGDPFEIARKVVDQMPPRLTGADLSAIATGALSRAAGRLCSQAEEERMQLEMTRGKKVDISEVLGVWDEQQRTPVVLLDDLLAVSSQMTPSLSEEELKKYHVYAK